MILPRPGKIRTLSGDGNESNLVEATLGFTNLQSG